MASSSSPRRRPARGGCGTDAPASRTPSTMRASSIPSHTPAWEERDTDAPGMFTSAVIAPRLLLPAKSDHRKYLVAAPGCRLMVVLTVTTGRRMLPYLKVHVLDVGREGWKETDDIGNAALFVGVNGSLCVSTREHPELKAGRVYYYNEDEDDLGPYKDARDDDNAVRVFSLKDGRSRALGSTGAGLQRGSRLPSKDDGYSE